MKESMKKENKLVRGVKFVINFFLAPQYFVGRYFPASNRRVFIILILNFFVTLPLFIYARMQVFDIAEPEFFMNVMIVNLTYWLILMIILTITNIFIWGVLRFRKHHIDFGYLLLQQSIIVAVLFTLSRILPFLILILDNFDIADKTYTASFLVFDLLSIAQISSFIFAFIGGLYFLALLKTRISPGERLLTVLFIFYTYLLTLTLGF